MPGHLKFPRYTSFTLVLEDMEGVFSPWQDEDGIEELLQQVEDMRQRHCTTRQYGDQSYVNTEVDALLEKAIASSDTDERNGYYTALQQWNAADNAIIPIYVPALISAVDGSVDGLAFDVYGRPLFYDVKLDK